MRHVGDLDLLAAHPRQLIREVDVTVVVNPVPLHHMRPAREQHPQRLLMLQCAHRRRVRPPHLQRRAACQRGVRASGVVGDHPVGEHDHEPAKRPRGLVDQPAADVARPARPARQPLQQLLLNRPIQPLDLSLLPRTIRVRPPADAPKREHRLRDRVGRELQPTIPPQQHRHPAKRPPLPVNRHRHPQRGELLRLRWAQRHRPPHDQPRELIDEQRHPRPLRPRGARGEHLDRKLLVITLVALRTEPRLIPQVHRPVPHRHLATTNVVALRRAQRPLERVTQRLSRRHLLAFRHELSMHGGDIPAPRQQQRDRPVARDHATPRPRRRAATCDPPATSSAPTPHTRPPPPRPSGDSAATTSAPRPVARPPPTAAPPATLPSAHSSRTFPSPVRLHRTTPRRRSQPSRVAVTP